MPTETDIGEPGPANQKIGGVPILHYFDFFSRGRGQVVRLFFEDAGIAYKDIRYTFDEYPQYRESKILDLNPVCSLPVLELDGRILTQSYPILRHFARQLKEYDGTTEEERYWVDAMCDVATDWRTLFVIALFSPNKETTYPEHCITNRPRYAKALNTHLSSHQGSTNGPFVLGDKISYADFVIYQICHDEGLTKDGRKGLKEYQRLAQLVNAVESRSSIKAFLQSDRYLG